MPSRAISRAAGAGDTCRAAIRDTRSQGSTGRISISITMNKNIERLSLLIILGAIVAFSWLKPLDATAEHQIEEGFKRAVASFAVARVLNGVISVAQGTEISIAPGGMGANLTPGQILDPVNDLVEQFSELMLIASVAFGIMKVLLNIGSYWVFSTILSVAALAWAAFKLAGRLPPLLLTKFLLVLIFVRFSVPLVTVGSDFLFRQFLVQTFNESQLAIESSRDELATLKPTAGHSPASVAAPAQSAASQPAQNNSWLDEARELIVSASQKIENRIEQVQQKLDPGAYIDKLKTLTSQLVDHIINLIVVFVLQTVVIPLVLMWALYRLCLALIDSAGRARETSVV